MGLGDISTEVITGGRGLIPAPSTIASHALALAYFVSWSMLYGAMLHWRAAMNAWVLAFAAAGTGFAVVIAVMATASEFSKNNMSSNLESGGLHYTSGLIHVGLVMESTLIFFVAIAVPTILQLGYLAFNETCCSWSGGDGGATFAATYLASLLYYHLAIAQAVKMLCADARPVYQVTGILSSK